jgi:hypothetical protein
MKIKLMGLRKILNLEKLVDFKLNETKNIVAEVYASPTMHQRLKHKEQSKALLPCFYHVKQANRNTMERMKGCGRC